MQTNVHLWSNISHFFLEWEMFQTKFVQNITTHCMFNNFFFYRKSVRLKDIMYKYCRAGRATDDKMTHAHCMFDT